MIWECVEGHKWKVKFNHIKNSGSWCQKCLNCPSCGLFQTNKRLCSYCKPQNNKKTLPSTKKIPSLRPKMPQKRWHSRL